MLYLRALLFLLLTGCFRPAIVPIPVESPTTHPTHEAIAVDLASKIVALVEKDRAYCSGVWVADDAILTAGHCLEDHKLGDTVQYAVESDVTYDGLSVSPRPATIVAGEARFDLALLRARDVVPLHGIAGVSRALLRQGEPVFTLGQPLGLWWSFSSGEIAAIRYYADEDIAIYYVQATSPISPGSSGGGLFDDRGQLVGITRGSFRRGELLNLFIHRDYIVEFLRGVL